MKTALLVFSLFATSHLLQAQEKTGHGRITGEVKDATSNLPVEYATVALNDPDTNTPVDGTVCDEKGKFVLTKIANGNYNVVISFIGFESIVLPVVIDDRKNNHDLGEVKLSMKAEILDAVTVEGQKALIEERVDRTIYNAENDATTRGGDATDVLKRVPMLSVDLEGNVSLRGNSNIRVLINNRPSTIAATSIADALKAIPADEIKSVEVITSPSAKYDAEGSSGIINIITKKNVLEGATLSVNTGVGTRGSNLGLNGAYRKGKIGLSLGGFGRAGYNVNGAFSNRQLTLSDNGTETLTTQSADTQSDFMFGRYTFGLDYDINKNNFITSSVQFGLRNRDAIQDNLFTQSFQNGSLVSQSLRDVDTRDRSGNVDVNLGFTHLYDKPQRELSILGQYSRNDRTNNFINNIFDQSTEAIENRFKNENESFNQETTLQVDYQSPIGETQMVEFGAKTILRDVSSDYEYFTAEGPDGPFVPATDESLSDVFNYQQKIAAGYLSYTLNFLKDYSIKAGTRYEYTAIDANFDSEQQVDIPEYGVLVPSLNLSKKLPNGNMVKLAYNRRIQRPSIQFLNPNTDASNPQNITVGNPSLDPEYTNNYELSYSTFAKGTTLNFSGFFRNTSNAIQSVREVVGDNVIRTTYQNIGQEDAYGLSVFANVNLGGKLSLNGGTDVFYSVLSNNVADPLYNASNEGWVASYRLFGNYNFAENWGFQFFGFYRGNRVQLQGSQGGFGIYSLAIKRDFADKRGSVGFGAENFFTPEFRIKSELVSPVLRQTSINTMRNMSFRLNFSYRIGKLGTDENSARRRRKSISNDDLKSGGDGQEGGGEMQNGTPAGRQGGPVMRRPSGGGTPAGAITAPKANPDAVVRAEGTWTYTVESPQGGEGTLTLMKEDDSLKGTIINERFNRETALDSVTLNGNELSFSYKAGFGGNSMNVSVKTVIEDNTMNGIMTVGDFGTFPFKGTRSE
ncbi:MAG TPA: TonB-dependent receptor [Cyclobacteriaceae bacterium]